MVNLSNDFVKILRERRAIIYQGNCEDLLSQLPDNSIDAIIIDPPFGVSSYIWDKDPQESVWRHLQRICPDGPIAVMGYTKQLLKWAQYIHLPFLGDIVWFKYNEHVVTTDLTRVHINIFIWGKSHKQLRVDKAREPYSLNSRNGDRTRFLRQGASPGSSRKSQEIKRMGNPDGRRCTDVWLIPAVNTRNDAHKRLHPNQKPILLLEKLVLLLTDENNIVLDCYMGSGTTGVAAIMHNRRFVGCELMPRYFAIARERLRILVNSENDLLIV